MTFVPTLFPTNPISKNVAFPGFYDKEVDAPTYLFQRGDERAPDKENPLAPDVPKFFDGTPYQAQAVTLPVESRYPQLKPEFIAVGKENIEERIQQAQQQLHELKAQTVTVQPEHQSWRADVVRSAEKELFQKFIPDEKTR